MILGGFEMHGYYKIQNVVCVPISLDNAIVNEQTMNLKPCMKHHMRALQTEEGNHQSEVEWPYLVSLLPDSIQILPKTH